MRRSKEVKRQRCDRLTLTLDTCMFWWFWSGGGTNWALDLGSGDWGKQARRSMSSQRFNVAFWPRHTCSVEAAGGETGAVNVQV